MFDRLLWQKDRMLLDDLVFRLQHYKNDNWDLGDNCFLFFKTKPLIDQYAKFWALRPDFRPRNVLELGMWDGGSVVFWFEYFQPQKHIGLDNQPKQDSPYFKEYVTSRGMNERIKTYWNINQSDSVRLREIVSNEFDGPIDLIIDDASHIYGPTRSSFETLFPLLRPGGLYIVEDWAWEHWQEFQAPDHHLAREISLTKLVFELVEATGTSLGFHPIILNLNIYQGFIVIERGEFELENPQTFQLDNFISRRSEEILPQHIHRSNREPMISDNYESICRSAAERWIVSPEIHPEDFLFRFVFDNHLFQSKEQAIEYYFSDGAQSAQNLHRILTEVCGFGSDRLHLLEFAAGYGCVTRHIKNVIPFCVHTAVDIHPQAISFIQEKLGTEAVLSQTRPDDLDLGQVFDVVFALSFFSHMPKHSFLRWLEKLASLVKPEGFFIFTTHGLVSQKHFPECHFDADGFYFQAISEQKDLNPEEYGISVVKPQYVLDWILNTSSLVLKYFHEGYWWKHQDLYVVKTVS